MKYLLFLILTVLSFTVLGQPDDFITPPDVGNGIDFETNPIAYIFLLIAMIMNWGLILLVAFFLIKTFIGIIKGTNEYLNSRSGEDSDTGKIVGSVILLVVGTVLWVGIFAIFEKIETFLIESVTNTTAYHIEYQQIDIDEPVDLTVINRTA